MKIQLEFGAVIPTRGTSGSVGLDLSANEDMVVHPGERKCISTGIACGFPPNTYGHIAARSGLSLKGIDIGAGILDPDYTGFIKVLIINNGQENFIVNSGDKIAQLIVEEYRHVITIFGNNYTYCKRLRWVWINWEINLIIRLLQGYYTLYKGDG